MMLQEFKLNLAESLFIEGKSLQARKRGWPSSTGSIKVEFEKKKSLQLQTLSQWSLQNWWQSPLSSGDGERKMQKTKCKAIPVFYCSKCKVNLYITKGETGSLNSTPGRMMRRDSSFCWKGNFFVGSKAFLGHGAEIITYFFFCLVANKI